MADRKSYGRPSVSINNLYSESMIKTLKYCPMFPSKPFENIEAANVGMQMFTNWYNAEHLHSGINFVTLSSKHTRLPIEI